MAKTERTIEDIVDVCEEKYELNVTKENKRKYSNFLKRQLKKHPEYDINKTTNKKKTSKAYIYFNFLVDKLLLFSYLIGETEITAGYGSHTYKKRIKGADDLYLLRPSETGHSSKAKERKTDRQLFKLIGRIRVRYYLHKDKFSYIQKRGECIDDEETDNVQNWGECIDELGEDTSVIKHLGKRIDYNSSVLKCHSPNPLTFNHGGRRVQSTKY
ncbi:hypothetical protein KY317_02070 [Candidatus Woesearchaeota archaeon]|nr:hypothetical protein [Candidatus Woesearchaeota archaeon]